MSDLSAELRGEFLNDKEYAHAYMESHVDAYIATQIKVLRDQREWSQERLANETGMRQARISVLENVDYAAWSINTLRRLARAFDVVLRVTFEEFGTEIGRMNEFREEGLQRTERVSDLSRAAAPEECQTSAATSGQIYRIFGTAKELVYGIDTASNRRNTPMIGLPLFEPEKVAHV
jgi:transcriptional regulator with XRE-family HTH domain